MLPDRLIPYREHEGNLLPLWLEPRDEVWLRELVDEAAACEGATADEADARIVETSFRLARLHGVSRRVVEAVWWVERRRYATRIDAPVPPEQIRRVLFDLAAERAHEEALATAAAELGITPDAILAALFADRAGARRLVPPATPATTRSLLEGYNRALAEALVVRTSEIIARVHAHTRRVVSAARLLGLMFQAESDEEGDATKLVVSGPLALFHETVKYGRALASWLHTVATTPAWSLEGTTRIGGQSFAFHLDASAPIPRVHALARATDSRVETRLAQDLRRHEPHVRVERESEVLRIDRRLHFPDFALSLPEGRVLVEVVGFWTPEYLARKAALLDEARVPIVFCVDARHAHGALAPSDVVVPFQKRIEVAPLLEACRRALRGRVRSGVLRHRLRFAPTPVFSRHAVAAGAAPAGWTREVFEDLTRGACVRGLSLGAHPVYGPQILLVGERFVARAGRDRRAADTLFVNAIAPRERAERAAAASSGVAAEIELAEELSGDATSAPRDDVLALFEKLPPAPLVTSAVA